MLSWLWLATALALASGCVTVPAKQSGIDAGTTNSPMNPNGTTLSRFFKRQTDKFASARKPAPNRVNNAPPNSEFYLTMAIAQEQAGDSAKAEEFYQKALASDPKSLTTLTGYAHFEDRRRHLNAATKLYKKALAKYPEEASVYNDLGLCYRRPGISPNRWPCFAKRRSCNPTGRCIATISRPCWSIRSGPTTRWNNC